MDLFQQIAANIHNIPEDAVTPEQRLEALKLSFGMLYGSKSLKSLRACSQTAGFRATYGGSGGGGYTKSVSEHFHREYKRIADMVLHSRDLAELEGRVLDRMMSVGPIHLTSPVVQAALSDLLVEEA